MFSKPRTPLLALLAVAVAAAIGAAQVPLGRAAILQSNGSTASIIALRTSGPATISPVGPISPALAAAASSMELDHLTTDLIVGSSATTGGGGAEIHRLRLSGLTVVSETLELVLPGTGGAVRSMQREPDGCILVLAADGSGAPALFRLAVTAQGMAAAQIPVTAPPMTNFQALTSDGAGNIFTCDFLPGSGFSSTVYTVGPAGGALTPTGATIPFSASDLELDLNGSGIHAGGIPTALLGPNYFCGGVPFQYGPTNPPFSDVVQEIAREPGAAGNLLVASAAGGVGASIWRVAGCAPPGALITTLPGMAVLKMLPTQRSIKYGCACPNSAGVLPTITQGNMPVAGGTWTLNLTGGMPSNGAFLLLGTATIAPLPLAGAPGCFQLNNRVRVFGTGTTAAGTATFTINIPPGLAGSMLFAQYSFRDAALNPAGIGVTAGLAAFL